MHPRYSFFWDSVTIEDVIFLNEKLEESQVSIDDTTLHLHITNPRLKDILEQLGVQSFNKEWGLSDKRFGANLFSKKFIAF